MNLPFYMIDISNFQLITSPIIPSDIKDSKDVVLAEIAVPGLNYQPIQYGGGGNRKLTFTLHLIKRGDILGNVLLLKQIDSLRNQGGLFNLFSSQFMPNPKVLFSWGIGSVPLIYYVKKADATHKQGWVNRAGFPQYSEIEFELWLDEASPLYIAEEIFRKVATLAAPFTNVFDAIAEIQTKKAY